jgi:hypothetical protein
MLGFELNKDASPARVSFLVVSLDPFEEFAPA